MQHAAQTYDAIAKKTGNPRELEADLLLNAAAKLQIICDGWDDRRPELGAALHFNRRLWSIFVTSATSRENPLPAPIRQNVANLGLYVFKQTLTILADPKPENLGSLININRQLAAGLLGRA
jgi:flagellar biosynthesis activator protein FlaF